MSAVAGRRPQPPTKRILLGITTIALTAAAALSACSGGGSGDDARVLAASAPTTERAITTSTTTAPTTSTPPTTSTTTAPTITSSSTSTTTTLVRQLTQPIAPPQDARGAENNPPIGRITIPAIGLDSSLEEGIRLTTLDRGPGHWPGSAMPGEVGNVVVAGHRTSRGAEFRKLHELAVGEEVVFTTEAGAFTYQVTGTDIVTPDALWITDPTDTPTATLFACHPLGSTAQRIVVHLALVA